MRINASLDLRASLREDLAHVLRELTDAKRDSLNRNGPPLASPGASSENRDDSLLTKL